MRNTRLTAVPDSEASSEIAPSPAVSSSSSALVGLFLLTLKTLSQKTIVSLVALADLLIIASGFVVWIRIMAQPTELQLLGAGMYGVFCLAAVFLRNRHARTD